MVSQGAMGCVWPINVEEILQENSIDALSLWAGQSVGLVSKIQPAGDIVREIVDEARFVLEGLAY
jgi:NAD(P)H-dependent flavin oxidoreductase YrpB (nitropropane dioxygenase family)